MVFSTSHCMSLAVNWGTRRYKSVHIPYKNSLCICLPHTSYISNRYSTSLFSSMYTLPFWNQTALCSHGIMWISFYPDMYLLPHIFKEFSDKHLRNHKHIFYLRHNVLTNSTIKKVMIVYGHCYDIRYGHCPSPWCIICIWNAFFFDNVQNCSQNYEYFHTSFQPFTVHMISGFCCTVLFCWQYTMHNSELCNQNHKIVSTQLKEKLKVCK
jgi:hypothetical protein